MMLGMLTSRFLTIIDNNSHFDFRSGLPASMSPTEKIKKMATDWNNASDALKEKYASKQQKDSDRLGWCEVFCSN